ncbi:unnamed protein product [Nezara viridula]|uniref:Uncharacterized protein n=1 Tax=Nezara viridula TaxID=85310 RepID=A0A9P0HR54_NEZVI|nr:unnamed protein product [Nezara viridula]
MDWTPRRHHKPKRTNGRPPPPIQVTPDDVDTMRSMRQWNRFSRFVDYGSSYTSVIGRGVEYAPTFRLATAGSPPLPPYSQRRTQSSPRPVFVSFRRTELFLTPRYPPVVLFKPRGVRPLKGEGGLQYRTFLRLISIWTGIRFVESSLAMRKSVRRTIGKTVEEIISMLVEKKLK